MSGHVQFKQWFQNRSLVYRRGPRRSNAVQLRRNFQCFHDTLHIEAQQPSRCQLHMGLWRTIGRATALSQFRLEGYWLSRSIKNSQANEAKIQVNVEMNQVAEQ